MSIVKTDKNGNLVASVNNSLDYTNPEGEKALRNTATALTEVAKEANTLSKMNQGSVAVSIQENDGKYTTYYPKETKDGSIALTPSARDQAERDKGPIYFNKKYDTDDKGILIKDEKTGEPKYHYEMNKTSEAAKNLLENIKVNDFQRQDGTEGKAIATRVSLNNPDITNSIIEYSKYHQKADDLSPVVAVISKEGVKIASTKELAEQKETSKEQAKPEIKKDSGMDR